MTADSRQRYHALDAARGILMFLGVLIHTSNVYTPGSTWIVSDPPGAWFLGLINEGLHVFRMPAFFWISGFFCAMTYTRSGSRVLLRSRFPRIAIPLLVTFLTLNVLQDYLVATHSSTAHPHAGRALPGLYHLWFLADLLVFIAIAAVLLPGMSRLARRPLPKAGPWLLTAVLALMSYSAELAVRATGYAYVPLLGITSLYRLAEYLPYFAVGMFLYLRRDLLDEALSMPQLVFPAALVTAVSVSAMAQGPATLTTEFARILQICATWACTLSVLSIFTSVFRTGTAFTRSVSDSAYTVYLFHHIAVVGLALALSSWNGGPWVKFLLVASGAAVFALAVHALAIRRIPILRLLFNGK